MATTTQTITVTVTTETRETEVLHFTAPEPPPLAPLQRVGALLEAMSDSSLFQNEMAEKMESCSLEIQNDQDNPEKVSLHLSELFHDVIAPMKQFCASHPAIRGQLNAFEGELKSILEELIPEEVSADTYLDRFLQVRLTLRKMDAVDKVFQKKRQELYVDVGEQLEQVLSDFQQRQGRIVAIHQKNKALHQKVEKALDEQIVQLQSLQESSSQTASNLLKLQKNIYQHDRNMEQLIRSSSVVKRGPNQ